MTSKREEVLPDPIKPMRLQRYLAQCGLGSRRDCEELITTGRITIDGKVVDQLGTTVNPGVQTITMDGERLKVERKKYFMLNKPSGYLCTANDPMGRRLVLDLFPAEGPRLFTIGRLDENTTGLLLVTNDGDLAQKLAHPRFRIFRTYVAQVAGQPKPEVYEELRRGLFFTEGKFRVHSVTPTKRQKDSTWVEVVMTEGQNREVRRLFARVGHKIMKLERQGYGPLRLGKLTRGEYRELSRDELASLHAVLERNRAEEDPTQVQRARRERSSPQAYQRDQEGSENRESSPSREGSREGGARPSREAGRSREGTRERGAASSRETGRSREGTRERGAGSSRETGRTREGSRERGAGSSRETGRTREGIRERGAGSSRETGRSREGDRERRVGQGRDAERGPSRGTGRTSESGRDRKPVSGRDGGGERSPSREREFGRAVGRTRPSVSGSEDSRTGAARTRKTASGARPREDREDSRTGRTGSPRSAKGSSRPEFGDRKGPRKTGGPKAGPGFKSREASPRREAGERESSFDDRRHPAQGPARKPVVGKKPGPVAGGPKRKPAERGKKADATGEKRARHVPGVAREGRPRKGPKGRRK